MKKDNNVFIISIVVVLAIVAWGLAAPANFESTANGLFNYLVGNFGWFYLVSMFSFVAFSVWIAFSKYGKVKLGEDDSEPEYSYISWFAMLFSAGMGIGLVFWGIAEPLNHFVAPLGMAGGTAEAASFAIKKSFFHWGLHPWANYSVLALALAYMQFRKGKPGLISSIFIPLLGEERVKGPIGKTIDILAIFATVAGVATSLGLGTLQINSGLNYMFGIPENAAVQIIIVAVVTVLFMISAISGLDKGIKFLSNANVGLATILLILTMIVGPTLLIINSLTEGIGMYLGEFIRDSFHIEAFGNGEWFGWWTIFYWAWWIAWAPFVGTFIARISKGRTIKEFVGGVLLAPTLASFIWFAVFGSSAINLGVEVATEAIKSTPTAFFVVMSKYPLGGLISVVAVILLCTFFVTSADSATFVLGMMSSNGDLNPSNQKKIIWGVIQSLLALALMLAGGLGMLQTASIAAAFPFAFVMIFAMVSLVMVLRSDFKETTKVKVK
ncbi:glycine betaine uptake BCCT transporter [Alkaliphilus hydrothermalis]|uniref:Glycine betaine transporter n=1 Tax=Alkaliphilus hydrothermalis TaxID=1482730 RepID=A0ABS2NN86_9FIRM|nr:BCCT family transporter [Alkaliphilus hydrothermalis]MBM7614367.1 glycine betaine transporter [Alkaliphilus hydrothermalis]